MSVQRVACAASVAVLVAAQVMSVSSFGLLGRVQNMSAPGAMGNSPLAQMLSSWKQQANTAAEPYFKQMMQPLSTIANNMLTMMLLSAQVLNDITKQKLSYLSNMANIPQPNATGSPTTPAPTLPPAAQGGNATTNATNTG